ncbi:MAG: hypothetical protein ACRC10_12870 [Thermoguttaceae bacterium]
MDDELIETGELTSTMTFFGETFFKAYSAEMNAASQAEPAVVAPFSPVIHPVHSCSLSSSPSSSLLTSSVSDQAIDFMMKRKRIAEEVLETSLVATDPAESVLDSLTSSASEKSRRLLKTREMKPQKIAISREDCEESESKRRSIYTAFESLQQVSDSAEKFFQDRLTIQDKPNAQGNKQSDKVISRSEFLENAEFLGNGEQIRQLSGVSQTVIDSEISNCSANRQDKPVPKRSPFLFPIHWPKCCDRLRESAPIQLKQLVDHLLHQVQAGKHRIAFCGNNPGCGCTTLLLCTARELAAYGRKTIVIDANFDNPNVVSSLQLPIAQGWEQLLSKNADFLSTQDGLTFSTQNTLSPNRRAVCEVTKRLSMPTSLSLLQSDNRKANEPNGTWLNQDRVKTDLSNKIIDLQYAVEPNLSILPLSPTVSSSLLSLQQVETILDLVCRPYDIALIDAGYFWETQKQSEQGHEPFYRTVRDLQPNSNLSLNQQPENSVEKNNPEYSSCWTENMERKVIELARFAVDGVLLIVGAKSSNVSNQCRLQESLLQESLQSYGIVQLGIAENGV